VGRTKNELGRKKKQAPKKNYRGNAEETKAIRIRKKRKGNLSYSTEMTP